MVAYINRFHGDSTTEQRLFFEFEGAGHKAIPLRHRASSDKRFMSGLKAALKRSQWSSAEELSRVTNHSLRAGGCTDMFVAGLPAELIRAIGGWATFCFLIYVRPQKDHKWKVAAQLVQAVMAAAGG